LIKKSYFVKIYDPKLARYTSMKVMVCFFTIDDGLSNKENQKGIEKINIWGTYYIFYCLQFYYKLI
jgi:hypothetical protein